MVEQCHDSGNVDSGENADVGSQARDHKRLLERRDQGFCRSAALAVGRVSRASRHNVDLLHSVLKDAVQCFFLFVAVSRFID